MSPAAATLASGALAYAGFSAICATTARHGRQFLPRNGQGRPARHLLHAAGWGLLAVSLLPCLATMGGGLGIVTWAAMLTAAALPLPLGLPYLPWPAVIAGPAIALAVAAVLIVAGVS